MRNLGGIKAHFGLGMFRFVQVVCVCFFFVFFGHLFCLLLLSLICFLTLCVSGGCFFVFLLVCVSFFPFVYSFFSTRSRLILLLSPGNGSFLTRSFFPDTFSFLTTYNWVAPVFPPFWIGAGNSILLAVKSNPSVLRNIIKAHKRIGKVVKAERKRPVPVANRYCFGTGLFFIQQF